jgi:hypothetical protein
MWIDDGIWSGMETTGKRAAFYTKTGIYYMEIGMKFFMLVKERSM